MSQKVCPSCGTAQPAEYLFCAECGTKLPEPKVENTTEKARPAKPVRPVAWTLVHLSRAGGTNVPYPVPADGLEIGSRGCDIEFADDRCVSARHAVAKPGNDGVVFEDAGSINGLFVRITAPHPLQDGDVFVCGDTVFKFCADAGSISGEDFRLFAAPDEKCPVGTITRIMSGGADGQTYPVVGSAIAVGREGADICFPEDRYMSRSHAAVEPGVDGVILKDRQSRNGTYIKTSGRVDAVDGDVVLVGRQLLRVEAKST